MWVLTFCVVMVAMTTSHVSCLEEISSFDVNEVLERLQTKVGDLQTSMTKLADKQERSTRGIETKLNTLLNKMDDMSEVLSALARNDDQDASGDQDGSGDHGGSGDHICLNNLDGSGDHDGSYGSGSVPRCPTGFTMVGSQCLLYLGNEWAAWYNSAPGDNLPRSWYSAQAECECRGATLAHMEDSDMSRVVMDYLRGNNLGFLVGARQYGCEYQWTATRNSIGNWGESQPDEEGGDNCVFYGTFHSSYYDVPCSSYEASYMCEAEVILG